MSMLLNAGEILGFAIYIEKNGYEFYTEIAKKFEHPKLMAFLHLLAEDEQNHERTFKTMQSSVSSFHIPESYPGEYESYMKDYLKTFAPKSSETMKALAARTESIHDALELALSFEKDSVVFYSSLKNMVKKEQQDILDKIIAEEIHHILRITHFKSTVIPGVPDVDAL